MNTIYGKTPEGTIFRHESTREPVLPKGVKKATKAEFDKQQKAADKIQADYIDKLMAG